MLCNEAVLAHHQMSIQADGSNNIGCLLSSCLQVFCNRAQLLEPGHIKAKCAGEIEYITAFASLFIVCSDLQ